MAKISTSISIDADVKVQAQELFADLGLDLPTAVNILLRQSVDEGSGGDGKEPIRLQTVRFFF